MDNINQDYETEHRYHPENFEIMWCDNCKARIDDSHDCDNCDYCGTAQKE